MTKAAELLKRRWRTSEPPDDVFLTPTMLIRDELRLLYTLARDHCTGSGRIVDAGCFLGGSTRALAAGVRDSDRGAAAAPIVSYDLFKVEQYYFRISPDLLAGTEVGDSLRPLFDKYLVGLNDRVEVQHGDLMELGWRGEPIELLFLDLLKTSELNDFVMREFFSRLIPGESIVVQQDCLWGEWPWINISMELLADHFCWIDDVGCSRVYVLETAIPDELLRTSVQHDLSPAEQLALMDRAVAPATGSARGMLELARAALLHQHGRAGEAAGEVRRVREEFSTFASVMHCADVCEPLYVTSRQCTTLRAPLSRTTLDISAIFPSIDDELGPYAHLFTGNVLNAGAGDRDISGLVQGTLYNQDIASGLHSANIDITGPLHEIPVPDGFFNTIICNAVMEHVANPEEVMHEFARVCAPGGVLYLTIPFMQPEHLDPTDFQRYTRDGLRLLCERHGFQVTDVHPVHSVYTTLAWIMAEWLTPLDKLRFRVLKRVLFPWLTRKAQTSKYTVPSLASAHRAIATRVGDEGVGG